MPAGTGQPHQQPASQRHDSAASSSVKHSGDIGRGDLAHPNDPITTSGSTPSERHNSASDTIDADSTG